MTGHLLQALRPILTGGRLCCLRWFVGQNNQAGKSILKTDYSENNTISQNLKIAVKILTKTMDSTTPSPERIELSVLRKEEDGSLVHHTLAAAEIQVLLDQIQKEIEEEQKKAEATTGDL
jgi:20S proteasome subunit alpha 3